MISVDLGAFCSQISLLANFWRNAERIRRGALAGGKTQFARTKQGDIVRRQLSPK